MTTYNTGNPLGSSDPRDLYDNAENLDEAVNSDELTFKDRFGKTKPTLMSAIDPTGLVHQAVDAADRAETARDAAFVNADVYPDVATGLASVADGEQFQVVEGDDIVRYRRDSANTQTEIARYPSKTAVDNANAYTTASVRGLRHEVNQKIHTESWDDLHTFTDVDGNIVARIDHEGMLTVVGIEEPVQVVLADAGKKVATLSEIVNRLDGLPNDLILLTDSDGGVVARVTTDGRYYIIGLENDIAAEFGLLRDEIDRRTEPNVNTFVAEDRTYKETVTSQVQTVLNMLMYSQTGAKAPVPLHYFPQNYSISKAWIDSINQFGHTTSTRLELNSPYRDDDGVCHPHVLEFYNGFRGYRYIAAITPYYLSNEAEENPCIYGSNDLVEFDLLDGFEQPLDVRPSPAFSNGHNSDNVLAYDPHTGELICIWRQTLRNPNNDGVRVDALWMRKTKDGYSWTDRERIFKATDHELAKGAGSPAIVYNVADGYWYMYLTTLSLTTDAMRLFKAKKLKEDAWEYAGTLVLPFKPWHQDIKIVGDKVCMMVYCYSPDNTIYFGIADDFLNFTWTGNLLLEDNGYKATFVPVFNDADQMALKILYTTDNSPTEVSEKWRMYMHKTNFIDVDLEIIQ